MTKRGTAAVVLAAGSGSRMNSRIRKQYIEISGKPLIYYALQAFEQSVIERVVLVVSPGEEAYCQREIVEKYGFHKVVKVTAGGDERYHSVFCGLQQLENCRYVLIHDGARPFITDEIIERTLQGALEYGACAAGMPAKDTIKISDENGFAKHTPERNHVWTIQTPQAFDYSLIRHAYEELFRAKDCMVTDDAMVVEKYLDRKVRLVQGSYYNIKITTQEDLMVAEVFLKEYHSGS